MSKQQLTQLALGLLVVLNIGLLATMYLQHTKSEKRHTPPRMEDTRNRHIRERFGFDELQLKAFDKSKERHREAMGGLRKKLEKASLEYYTLPTGDAQKQKMFAEADALSDSIYVLNNRHFDEVRQICRPEQLPAMDQFIGSLLRPDKGQKPRRPRK